jgi:hypothetical protein
MERFGVFAGVGNSLKAHFNDGWRKEENAECKLAIYGLIDR